MYSDHFLRMLERVVPPIVRDVSQSPPGCAETMYDYYFPVILDHVSVVRSRPLPSSHYFLFVAVPGISTTGNHPDPSGLVFHAGIRIYGKCFVFPGDPLNHNQESSV